MTDRAPGDLSGNDELFVDALLKVSLSGGLPGDGSSIAYAAASHGIVIPMYRAAVRGDLGTTVPPELAAMARRRRAGALKLSVLAGEISELLQVDGIRHVVLKGPAVAQAYEDQDREYVNVNVLVAPQHMKAAIAALQAQGASILEDVSWPRLDGIAELPLGLECQVTVDLHADLVQHAVVRREFRVSTENLLDRATSVRVNGRWLPVLAPEDNLIHVALHAMIAGGDRLVWLVDLDALVRQGHVSWPKLVDRCQETRTALVVGVMLQRAVDVLGTQVPLDVLGTLERRGVVWTQLLRLFERCRPVALNYGRSLHGQVLVRATRQTTGSSLATLARLLWTDVLVFVVTDPHHPWRERLRTRFLPKR